MSIHAWFALKNVPGIGNILFKRLIDHFGDPLKIISASVEELQKIRGVSIHMAGLIKSCKIHDDQIAELDTTFRFGCRVITLIDDEYPSLLREIPDPPPYLFVKGRIPSLPMVAIVGSRSASRYGLIAAERLSGELTSSGATVVSGLARGVDTAAHRGALERKGYTVAVLGSGLGHIYPPENRKLAEKISENGAVISEFSYNSEPEAHNFPMRNRIISGMCLGTVVVEAASKSGSLITARLAAEQNREVFAVPGNITSFKSSGTHSLIKQGAHLVESVSDIIEELPLFRQPSAPDVKKRKNTSEPDLENLKNKFNLDFNELSVIKVLDSYPAHIDEILRLVSMESGILSAVLLKLELIGMVNQSPGKMFSLNEDLL